MQRLVVKIGSSSLTSSEGGLNRDRISFYAGELARLMDTGAQVLLVTSGAVAAGFRAIGYASRPKALAQKQAAAAVGQGLLMQCYNEALAGYSKVGAQILLTRYDFTSRKRMGNAQMAIEELLAHGVLPIINENDTVSVDELKFGDNDTLSALVANLVKADRLIIITDTDGLYTDDPRRNPDARKIPRVGAITGELLQIAGGAGSAVGTGGMRSKIEAARIGMRGGVQVFVGRVEEPGDLLAAVNGSGKGTYFDTEAHTLPVKKQWIGYHSVPKGRITVDDGAVRALTAGGKSLLPAGVVSAEGEFHPGDVVEVVDAEGRVIGRGVTNYAAWQLVAAAGLGTDDVRNRFEVARIEVIHRDEWMTLADAPAEAATKASARGE
ncbi:glutamate 5-kinase [Paenibacillus thermoaerophilus]|uniref:Glutamate 5-kinase n=1 Tax=Paenibacillus thermoaerophilus TaxID=1215385 RepID=A0ABW2V6K6_9BACL|nr:glutamate 5-kinase [Paenibacillus thermoaerophilus]TMV18650.1 glutamate 5-kinase [Paenibacillus thermoaerophilus]